MTKLIAFLNSREVLHLSFLFHPYYMKSRLSHAFQPQSENSVSSSKPSDMLLYASLLVQKQKLFPPICGHERVERWQCVRNVSFGNPDTSKLCLAFLRRNMNFLTIAADPLVTLSTSRHTWTMPRKFVLVGMR